MESKKVESFVGIDVSKDTLDVRLEPLGESLHVSNDEVGISLVRKRLQDMSPTLIVMEATGGSGNPPGQ